MTFVTELVFLYFLLTMITYVNILIKNERLKNEQSKKRRENEKIKKNIIPDYKYPVPPPPPRPIKDDSKGIDPTEYLKK